MTWIRRAACDSARASASPPPRSTSGSVLLGVTADAEWPGPGRARAECAGLDRARGGAGSARVRSRCGGAGERRPFLHLAVAVRVVVRAGALARDRLARVRVELVVSSAARSGRARPGWRSCSSAPHADSPRRRGCSLRSRRSLDCSHLASTSRPSLPTRRRAPRCRPRAQAHPTWCSWCSTRSVPIAWGATGTRATPSPTFDALAREGAWFADATSPATWSLPAHASLFTGRYPTSHGANLMRRSSTIATRRSRRCSRRAGTRRSASPRTPGSAMASASRAGSPCRISRGRRTARGSLRGPAARAARPRSTRTRAARSSPTTSRRGGARGPRTGARPSCS